MTIYESKNHKLLKEIPWCKLSPIAFPYNTSMRLLVMKLYRLLRHCTNFVNGVIFAADFVNIWLACCLALAALPKIVAFNCGKAAPATCCWHLKSCWHKFSRMFFIIRFFAWHILKQTRQMKISLMTISFAYTFWFQRWWWWTSIKIVD